MNQFIINMKNINYINFLLISLLPIGLLVGSLVSNTIVLLIVILFLMEMRNRNNFFFVKDINFYFLLLINFYLILNSILISENDQSLVKAIGFFRFIFLSYAIFYYFKFWKKQILKIWFIIFLVVSVDIIFELFFGFNMLGFESVYEGRIASFTGDEVKIGGFYFGFILLSLNFIYEKKKFLILLAILFFVIALMIGERSNFLKILCMYILFFILFLNSKLLKKLFLSLFFLIIATTVILTVHNLKSKFVHHIFSEELTREFKSNNKINYLEVISKSQYLSHYYIAYKIFKDHKVFGTGFKSFRIESRKKEYQIKDIYGASTHPHQIHFEILSELGIVGYLLIFANLIFVLFSQLKYKKNSLNKSAILFLIASILPILPSGSFFTSYVATIFFINYSFLIRPNLLNNVNK